LTRSSTFFCLPLGILVKASYHILMGAEIEGAWSVAMVLDRAEGKVGEHIVSRWDLSRRGGDIMTYWRLEAGLSA